MASQADVPLVYNGPMMADRLSPIGILEERVLSAAFDAAPEKAEALNARVKLASIKLQFVRGPSRGQLFSVSPQTRIITVYEQGLELLWAASFAFTELYQTCWRSQASGRDIVDACDFPNLQRAFRLYGWALSRCLSGSSIPWPEGSPSPADTGPHAALATKLFLVAVGWILLHESAHVFLRHASEVPDSLKKREEADADQFATDWLLNEIDDRRMLQERTLGIAIATLTLVGVELWAKQTDPKYHPAAVERLNKSLRGPLPDDDAELASALAISVLQAHFSIFGVSNLIPDESIGSILDHLCLCLRRHRSA